MTESRRQSAERSRTATRMRYVAPPGMELEERENLKTIGRYEILEALGKGTMGIVYKARDPLLDRIVAVKTIVSPRGSGRQNRKAYLERFEREAKAAAKMQHPSIVTIFDVGSEEGQPFMVLEYLPGDSLADRLDKVRIPLGKGVQTALDLAAALGFAHSERIVHRDVKPANVLNAGDNRWKLADFGIARMPDSDLTQVGVFMGTPGYAPPEAVSQGRYTPQADVFAWGAVLYELLSGRIPYEGPDTRTTNGYVLKKTARSPREFDSSIPEVLAEVCMTALHPSIDVRYADGHVARAALEESWERCINEELVGPRAFSGREVPHDRAPKLMHSGATGLVPAISENSGPPFSLSEVRVGDDDPTKIMAIRTPQELARLRGEETDPNAAIVAAAKKAANHNDELDIEAAAGYGDDTESELLLSDAPKAGLWAAVLFAALLTGGLLAYYVINAL
ncbi:MAG: serine/threonine protein kinase [Myxococcales bacterium]|nr:serine/threonine protein kinase [Myxococcales bacterium]